jgi:hypothetical protein
MFIKFGIPLPAVQVAIDSNASTSGSAAVILLLAELAADDPLAFVDVAVNV